MTKPTACGSCGRGLRFRGSKPTPGKVLHSCKGLCAACYDAWVAAGRPPIASFSYTPGAGGHLAHRTQSVTRELRTITVTVPTAGLPAEPKDAEDRIRLAIATALDNFGGHVQAIAETSSEHAVFTLYADIPEHANPAQLQHAIRDRLAKLEKGHC